LHGVDRVVDEATRTITVDASAFYADGDDGPIGERGSGGAGWSP